MDTDALIESFLAGMGDRLDLDQQRKRETLDEMRSHLLDAVAFYRDQGLTPSASLERALLRFGPQPHIAEELNRVYAGWGTADAIVFTALPVLMGLLLRWLVFAPGGSAIGWEHVLTSIPFWIVALAALLIPLLKFPKWRYALASWTFFWGVTVLFMMYG